MSPLEAHRLLFASAWRPGAKRNLHMADTVLFRDGAPETWLFTGKDGLVLRKRRDALLRWPAALVDGFKRVLAKRHGTRVRPHTKIARVWVLGEEQESERLLDEVHLRLLLAERVPGPAVLMVQCLVPPCAYRGSGRLLHSVRRQPQDAFGRRGPSATSTVELRDSGEPVPLAEELHAYLAAKCAELLQWMDERGAQVLCATFQFSLSEGSVPVLVGVQDVRSAAPCASLCSWACEEGGDKEEGGSSEAVAPSPAAPAVRRRPRSAATVSRVNREVLGYNGRPESASLDARARCRGLVCEGDFCDLFVGAAPTDANGFHKVRLSSSPDAAIPHLRAEAASALRVRPASQVGAARQRGGSLRGGAPVGRLQTKVPRHGRDRALGRGGASVLVFVRV